MRKQSRLLGVGPAGVNHRAGPATFAAWLAPHLRPSGFRGQDLFDFFPQPAVCWIILHTLVPVQVGFEAGRLEREGMYLVHQIRVQQLRMALRQGQQHIRLTHHHAGREVALAAQKHLPAKPPAVKFDVDQAGTVALRGDLNMALRQISVQVEFACDRRVTPPGDDHESFIQEPLMPNAIAYRHGGMSIARSTEPLASSVSRSLRLTCDVVIDIPGRIHHCMRTLGAAERALELLCRRSLQRVAFGKPLADLGANADVIANARIMLEQARLLTLKAAWMLDEVGTKGARSEISQIKVAVPNIALEIIDQAIQMHGGAGVSSDFPLAEMFAAIRTLRIADGPDEVHRALIARLELRKYTAKGMASA